jgi:hypothetical protein
VTPGVRWDSSSFPWISSQHTFCSDTASISESLIQIKEYMVQESGVMTELGQKLD